MLSIGEYQTLTINREAQQGFYLKDESGAEVLLPRTYITPDMHPGDPIEVFVYCDSEDKEVATTLKPALTVGQFAYLRITDVNEFGAFADWGIPKELFIPFRNQGTRLVKGRSYVVTMYVDEFSNRLVGTTKLKPFLRHELDASLEKGREVDLLVYARTDLGYKVIINQTYAGLVYDNEVVEPLHPGQQLKGYIKPAREDGKIDVSLHPVGHQSIEPNARKILEKLENSGGFLPFTDKSDPDLIWETFGISKKLFKKALGALYRQRLVDLREDGIYGGR